MSVSVEGLAVESSSRLVLKFNKKEVLPSDFQYYVAIPLPKINTCPLCLTVDCILKKLDSFDDYKIFPALSCRSTFSQIYRSMKGSAVQLFLFYVNIPTPKMNTCIHYSRITFCIHS